MFRQSPCPKILIKKSTESPSMTKQCFLIWPFCSTCRGNFRLKFCLGFGCCPHCFILLKNLFSQKFCKCAVNIGVAQIRGSSRSSLWQLGIAKCFADANIVFIVIALAKILPRWLFGSKIYIQFTIFNTYFYTKLLFTNNRYHLHMLEKCLYVPQEVRSMIYFWQFIHPLSIHSCGNGTSFALTSYIIESVEFFNIIFIVIFKQLLFSFILLPFVHLPVPKKNKTCDIKRKVFIWIFLLKFLFSVLSIFVSYLSF